MVKSRDALMDAAYDDQVYVDDRTIDSHIKRLRKKFKAVDDDFDMIETLYGVGYRFKEALSARPGDGRDAAHDGRRSPTAQRRAGERAPAVPTPRSAPRRGASCCAASLLVQRASSSLTRRIVVLNLAGLVVLLVGIPLPQPVPRRA